MTPLIGLFARNGTGLMIAACTVNGALALEQGDRLGSLNPGTIAVLTVIDQESSSLPSAAMLG